MGAVRNPFVPGAGTQPAELTGRSEFLERARVALECVRIGRPAKSIITVSLRGIGKTVLLSRIRQTADALGYRTGLSLDADPELGIADTGDLETDLPDLFSAVARAAAARQTFVAIFIDEIQYLSERDMSALIMAMHRVAQEAAPVILMAAGLPRVVGLTGRSKSYAERLFDFPTVDALSREDAVTALQSPVEREGGRWEREALDEVMAVTRGYPYFLQEWRYHSWNGAAGPQITHTDVRNATSRAIQRLDESFFRVRFDRLTPREKDYMRAMAEFGEGAHRSGDIASRLAVSVERAGPLRTALIGKGMIYSPAHGDTAFTVPMFDEYLRRVIPGWDTPARRSGRGRPPGKRARAS